VSGSDAVSDRGKTQPERSAKQEVAERRAPLPLHSHAVVVVCYLAAGRHFSSCRHSDSETP